jgi:hypothetical protein
METIRFDCLVKSLISSGTRRGVVRLLAALPIPAAFAALTVDEEPVAACKRHKHGKKHCAKAGQTPTKKRKHCCKGLAQDASDRCFAICSGQGNACPDTQLCVSGICQPCDVCASGCPFSEVQQAIDGSAAATLVLCAGLYPGGVNIDRNLTLIGAGAGVAPAPHTVLDADGSASVVTIDPGAIVTLQRVRITGGIANNGGGIYNLNGSLTLNECTVSGNEASGDGGGILNNTGDLTLTNSTVSENAATNNGGGIINLGGVVTLNTSSVAGNNTENGNGGGILNSVGTVILHGSSVVNNHAGHAGGGGGIYNAGTVDCSDNNTVAVNTAGNPPQPSNCVDDAGGSGCDCQP